jgi:hypothetical protein
MGLIGVGAVLAMLLAATGVVIWAVRDKGKQPGAENPAAGKSEPTKDADKMQRAEAAKREAVRNLIATRKAELMAATETANQALSLSNRADHEVKQALEQATQDQQILLGRAGERPLRVRRRQRQDHRFATRRQAEV